MVRLKLLAGKSQVRGNKTLKRLEECDEMGWWPFGSKKEAALDMKASSRVQCYDKRDVYFFCMGTPVASCSVFCRPPLGAWKPDLILSRRAYALPPPRPAANTICICFAGGFSLRVQQRKMATIASSASPSKNRCSFFCPHLVTGAA